MTTFLVLSRNRIRHSLQVSWPPRPLSALSIVLPLVSGRESHEMYATAKAHARINFRCSSAVQSAVSGCRSGGLMMSCLSCIKVSFSFMQIEENPNSRHSYAPGGRERAFSDTEPRSSRPSRLRCLKARKTSND